MGEPANVEYGDREIAMSNEILRSVVGSGVHGIAIVGTDDHDEMGVYVEPPGHVLGLDRDREDYVWRTQPEGVRSGHGDVDLVLYSLRKYLRLAIKGNPTVMLPMFAPRQDVITLTPLGQELRDMRHDFLTQQTVERFLGYMGSQFDKMHGGTKRNPAIGRPELIERYGWDVKYGSHALRLAYQAQEIATDGTLTLPLPRDLRERVLAVKRGEVSRDEVSRQVESIHARVMHMLVLGQTRLPAEVDSRKISDWMIDAQQRQDVA